MSFEVNKIIDVRFLPLKALPKKNFEIEFSTFHYFVDSAVAVLKNGNIKRHLIQKT